MVDERLCGRYNVAKFGPTANRVEVSHQHRSDITDAMRMQLNMTQYRVPRTPCRRRRRKVTTARRVFRVSLLILVIAAIIGGVSFAVGCLCSRSLREAASAILSHEDKPERAFPGRDSVNILFLGKDEDRDQKDRVLRTKGRTDAIMFAHIDFRNREVNILSIPRDSLVRIPGYRGRRRINSAHALGGPDLLKKTIENLVGIAPDYFALMDYGGFEKAVDEIGGVWVDVDKNLDYDDSWGNLHIHLKPGRQLLDGYESMGYVRYRHSNAGGGDSDLVRIARQQELLSSVKSRLMQPGVIVRIPRVLDIVRDHLRSDMSPAQMICLARFLKSLPPSPGIKMVTIPARPGGGNYIRPDIDATRELADKIFRGTYSMEGTPVSMNTRMDR